MVWELDNKQFEISERLEHLFHRFETHILNYNLKIKQDKMRQKREQHKRPFHHTIGITCFALLNLRRNCNTERAGAYFRRSENLDHAAAQSLVIAASSSRRFDANFKG